MPEKRNLSAFYCKHSLLETTREETLTATCRMSSEWAFLPFSRTSPFTPAAQLLIRTAGMSHGYNSTGLP